MAKIPNREPVAWGDERGSSMVHYRRIGAKQTLCGAKIKVKSLVHPSRAKGLCMMCNYFLLNGRKKNSIRVYKAVITDRTREPDVVVRFTSRPPGM